MVLLLKMWQKFIKKVKKAKSSQTTVHILDQIFCHTHNTKLLSKCGADPLLYGHDHRVWYLKGDLCQFVGVHVSASLDSLIQGEAIVEVCAIVVNILWSDENSLIAQVHKLRHPVGKERWVSLTPSIKEIISTCNGAFLTQIHDIHLERVNLYNYRYAIKDVLDINTRQSLAPGFQM